MERLYWDPSLSVQIELIDNQHKQLLEIVNNVQNAIITKTQKIAVNDIFEALFLNAKINFKNQEYLFNRYNYPFIKEHQKEHNDYLIILRGYRERLPDSSKQVCDELLVFLKAWFENHIKVSDKKYASLLNEQGVR